MSTLSENENTRHKYFELSDLMKDAVDKEYENCHKICDSQVELFTMYDEQLLQSLLTINEELIPLNYLNVENYYINLASEPYSEKHIDFGFWVKMYLTNKRLILLDSAEYHNPILEHGRRTKVGCQRKDSVKFTAFPLNNIYGASLHIENDIVNASFVNKIGANIALSIIGIISTIFGLMLISIQQEIGYLLIFLGIILMIVGFLYKSENIYKLQPKIEKKRILRLVTLDPIYKNRASLTVKIYVEQDIESIVGWIKELQNRCENIVNPKEFETIINV